MKSVPLRSPLFYGVVITLILGVFFRFANLDHKVFWIDESYTSLRVSGYQERELNQALEGGEVTTVTDLWRFQYPSPDRDLAGTLKSIAAEDPHHPPLYYLIVRSWHQLFGDSVAVARSLSAVASLFLFPALYWFCRELMLPPATAWVTLCLVAVSPFQIHYAQEAREYGLWAVTVALASAALLRALRLGRWNWGTYIVTMSVSLYCHWFSVLVAISHGLYVLVTEVLSREVWVKRRLTSRTVKFVLAWGAILATFVPWIGFVALHVDPSNFADVSSWTDADAGPSDLIKSWMISLSRLFLDVDRGWCWGINSNHCSYPISLRADPLLYFILPFLALTGYALWFMVRHTPRRTSWYLLSLIGVTGLALTGPDLLLGDQRSSMTRYFVPSILGLQIVVGHCLSAHLFGVNTMRAQIGEPQMSGAPINETQIKGAKTGTGKQFRWAWQAVLAIVLTVGVVSNVVSLPARSWWTKIHNYDTYGLAEHINQSEQPVLLYPLSNRLEFGTLGNYIMPLAHLLRPETQILTMSNRDQLPPLPKSAQDIYTLNPSKALQAAVDQSDDYSITLVYDPATDYSAGLKMPARTLWKISPKRS